ncbi:hypothetical protein PybrP1_005282 [[Pythium] brassicae (nom. inval.)]|nr:hypothetical protein PybrP1_005282 [[Pythium] brassicae (nom. inval.)]
MKWLQEKLADLGETLSPYFAGVTLVRVVQNGHLAVAKCLVAHGHQVLTQRKTQLPRYARNGSLEMIQWLHVQRVTDGTTGWIDAAAPLGHLHIVQWVYANIPGDTCSAKAMNGAARNGFLEVLQLWLHENRTEGCTVFAMDCAAANGHLDIVKWLHANRTEGSSAIDGAAGNGHLDIIKWLHENRTEGCTTEAMDGAAKGGHLEIVRWLHENRTEGCTTEAMDGAAKGGHLEIIRWLHENRTEGCTTAAMHRTNSLEKLLFLREKNIVTFNPEAIAWAISKLRFEIFQWTMETAALGHDEVEARADRVAALAHAGAVSNDILELALLRLWTSLQHCRQATPPTRSPRDREPPWTRIAQLLFATDSDVARAAAAVTCAAAQQLTLHASLLATRWWSLVLAKTENCCCSTRQRDAPAHQLQPSDLLALAEQLLLAVGAVLRTACDASRFLANSDERAREGVELLLCVSSSPTRRLATCATAELADLLHGRSTSAPAMQALATSASGFRSAAAQLSQRPPSDCGATPNSSSSSKQVQAAAAEETERQQLQCARFDLLLAALHAVESHDAVALQTLREIDALALAAPFLSHPHPALQERALLLLHAAVLRQQERERERGGNALCATVRTSGLLITLCWLTGHSHSTVAAAAGVLVDAVVERSSPTDVLRALLEQGCAVILSALANADASELPLGGCESDRTQDGYDGETGSGAPVRSGTQLLQWMAAELVREQRVVHVAVASVLRSSNVLLQRNVLLSLLLLSRKSSELKRLLLLQHQQETPEREKPVSWDDLDFLTGVVLAAVEANEDGALARSLLSATTAWCDKSSTLRLLDENRGSFRQHKSRRAPSVDDDAQSESERSLSAGGGDTPSSLDQRRHCNVPPFVVVMCKRQVAVQVDAELLYALSKLAQRHIDSSESARQQQQQQQQLESPSDGLFWTTPTASEAPQLASLPLDRFDACTVRLLVDVLPKSQQEAAAVLRQQSVAELSELVELAKAAECAKCWHLASFALSHHLRVRASRCWFDVFAFAARTRHPSLLLRAARAALECDNRDTTTRAADDAQQQQQEQQQEQQVSHLKAAAFALYRELLSAERSPSDARVHA